MDITDRLYVEIVPCESAHAPVPHPVKHGRFDINRIYKVLGMYNPSETSEAYFVLSNADREVWFISNRHLRVAGLFDGDALSLSKEAMTHDHIEHPRINGNGNLTNGQTNGKSNGNHAPHLA